MYAGSSLLRRQILDGILHGDGNALELGFGEGKDALLLEECGYNVEALDRDSTLVEHLRVLAGSSHPRLKIVHKTIESVCITPQQYSLIHARNSLPFIGDPRRVLSLIKDMATGLRPEGRLCFTLFGPRDGWSNRRNMSFFEYEDMVEFLDELPLQAYYRSSQEQFANTTTGVRKLWHVHEFIYFKQPLHDPHLLSILNQGASRIAENSGCS